MLQGCHSLLRLLVVSCTAAVATTAQGDPNVGYHCSLLDPPSQQDSL